MNNSTAVSRLVAAAFIRDDRALLARRTPQMRWYANLWDLPGGHVEQGETERQAVVREVNEELGVAISEPTGEAATRLFDYDSAGVRTADLSVWIITDWAGNITNNSPREHLELRWFTPSELASIEIAHPEYIAFLTGVLRMYFETKKN